MVRFGSVLFSSLGSGAKRGSVGLGEAAQHLLSAKRNQEYKTSL